MCFKVKLKNFFSLLRNREEDNPRLRWVHGLFRDTGSSISALPFLNPGLFPHVGKMAAENLEINYTILFPLVYVQKCILKNRKKKKRHSVLALMYKKFSSHHSHPYNKKKLKNWKSTIFSTLSKNWVQRASSHTESRQVNSETHNWDLLTRN